jgi:hypothetical protein
VLVISVEFSVLDASVVPNDVISVVELFVSVVFMIVGSNVVVISVEYSVLGASVVPNDVISGVELSVSAVLIVVDS